MGIGENIKKFRLAYNMEQKELGVALNVSDKTVSSWEVGRTEPKMGMIELIAETFGVEKSDIIDGNLEALNSPRPAKKSMDLTTEEQHLIEYYRDSDDEMKDTIKRLLAYQKRLKEGKI